MTFEKLAVLGVGAIGSTIGAYLARAGQDITLLDMWPAHVDKMKGGGLKVTAQDEEFTVKVRAVHLADASSLHKQFDAVFLAVKSYDSLWAVKFIEPYLKQAGILVPAQNSINEDWVAPVVGYTRVIGCVVTLAAGLYEPGHVLRTSSPSWPSFALGELNGMITPRVEELVKIFSLVGPTHATANLWGERWAKLTVNCMQNALGGITGMNNVEIIANQDLFRIFVKIAGEVLTVAQTLGVQPERVNGIPAKAYLNAAHGVGFEDLLSQWREARQNVSGRSSLLQDVMKGRRTEVDYLNGYVVRKGREVGVPTPMNEAIVDVTKRLEEGELRQDARNLALLTRYL